MLQNYSLSSSVIIKNKWSGKIVGWSDGITDWNASDDCFLFHCRTNILFCLLVYYRNKL